MDFKERIKERGLKQNWIAKKIGISETMLSLFLSGERNLSQAKEQSLNELLS